MNKLKNIFYLLGLSLMISFFGCSDPDDELTSVDYDRLFSVTELEAKLDNKTNIRLTWIENKLADSYTIELYENDSLSFTNPPVKTFKEITGSTYTIENLMGELFYSVRVQAVNATTAGSKWSVVAIQTGSEQIFFPVDDQELTESEVTLRWPAGQRATNITLTPGDIDHMITEDEITAGAVTISGLESEVRYTAKLMNGTKTRGTVIFTTLLDLDGATPINPNEDLAAIIAGANDGDVFALLPGEYAINADIAINKTIALKAAKPAEPTVVKGAVLRVKTNVGLSLSGITFDGTGAKDNNQMIIYDEAGNNAPLLMENCVITNYIKGTMYVNNATKIESVTIKGCTYSNIICDGGDFIDFRNGIAPAFNFIENTAYNSASARDFFRMDAGGSTNFPGIKSVITISNNTFYQVAKTASNRMLYIRLANHEIEFTKNILANTLGYYTNQSATTIGEMDKNNYFEAPNFTGSTVSGAKNDTGNYTSFDPQFEDAANGNFKVNNSDVEVGDPRWLE